MNSIMKVALFDEIAKLAEEPKKGLKPALRAMGVAAVGGGLGYGVADLMSRKMKFFNQIQMPAGTPLEHAKKTFSRRITGAKVLLPLLSGTSMVLADRYRKKLNEEYSQVRGYKDPFKKDVVGQNS
jgi:hypothetical protein